MTTAPYQRLRGGSLAFDDQAARIARPVVGSHTMLVANAANGALLDGPAAHGAIYDVSAASATTWSLSYVRSAQARYLEVRATLVSTSTSGTVRIKFTATDAAGNTVSHTSSAVPDGYRDNTTTVYPPAGSSVWEMARGLSGFIDVDAGLDQRRIPCRFGCNAGRGGGAGLRGSRGRPCLRDGCVASRIG